MILLIFVICATAAGYSVYGAGNKDEVAVGAGEDKHKPLFRPRLNGALLPAGIFSLTGSLHAGYLNRVCC